MVQYEFEKRKDRMRSGASCFSSKIVCKECGNFYGPKVWHSTDKYRQVIWRCNAKYKSKKKCQTPHVTENQIREGFISAINSLIKNKNAVIKDCNKLICELDDIYLIEEKEIKLQSERTVLYNSMEKLIEKNSSFKINQTEYNEHYEKFKNQYNKINRELSEIEGEKLKYKVRKQKVQNFTNKLRENEKLVQSSMRHCGMRWLKEL